MEYKRPIFQLIKDRLITNPSYIQVISGPRQIGKTTLVKQLFQEPNWHGIYIVADGFSEDSVWIQTQFNLAQQQQKNQSKPVILAIDEIQKIPGWSETIKRIYDEQKFNSNNPITLILLGSSNWLMQKGISESLAGRFEQWNLSHWTFNEMHSAFNLSPEKYAYFGSYPGAMPFMNDESRWKSYVKQSLIETAITKDILLMNSIEKPALMRKLFELGTLYSGKILSYTKILGQLQEAKNTTTLSHYLNLLEHAGLLCGLSKYSIDQARKRNSIPKWQTMNNALLGALWDLPFEAAQQDKRRWGQIIESTVGAHFIAHKGDDLKVFYWNESNAEVDFILEWQGKYVGVEVKLSSDKVTGLKKFAQQFKPHKIYQLGESTFPWQEIIKMDPRELF